MKKLTCAFVVLLAIFLLSCNFVAAEDANSTEISTADSDGTELSAEDIVNPNAPKSNNTELSASYIDNVSELESAITDKTKSTELNMTQSTDSHDDALNLADSNTPKTKANAKTKTYVTLKTNHLKTKDKLTIFLKDQHGFRVKNKVFSVTINMQKYNLKTNSKGYAKLNINHPARTYKARIIFVGDEKYESLNTACSLSVSKIKTSIGSYKNVIINNYRIYSQLKDTHSFLANKKVQYILNGKTFERTTKTKGETNLKIKLKIIRYNIIIKFAGDEYYRASSKNFKFYVINKDSLSIGNDKLITNGYLRIYLKDLPAQLCSNQEIQINVDNNKFNIETDDEGIVVMKPQAKAGTHKVTAKFGTYSISKNLRCYNGDTKDPLYESIPLSNGKPDIDIMQWYFVMANDDATYTLSESQYKETLRYDSCCLYMYKKLPKYTLFKSESNPSYYHIIKREKWNVIERELNTRLVKNFEYDYWPDSITACLKGKSYTYPVVRNIQHTEYTCGPTSASLCSQALKKFNSEKYYQVKGNAYNGINIPDLKNILDDNEFDTSYFYDMDSAVEELKKGGCALIAYLPNHYVSVIDVSNDGDKILVSNSYGTYNVGGDSRIPTDWVYLSTFKSKFAGVGLVVRLDYNLKSSEKNVVKNYYSSMGPSWTAHNTNERIPDVGK